MPNISIERLSSLIHKELVKIINSELYVKELNYINLTEVRLTKDLSYATIFFTVLSEEKNDIEKYKKVLSSYQKQIRFKLAGKIKNIRKIPELHFKYDDALAYGNHIEKLLKTIK